MPYSRIWCLLPARVSSVSADTVPRLSPQVAGYSPPAAPSYQVLLEPLRTGLKGRQVYCMLRPGMEINADVVTRQTTVLAFLINKLRLGT